MTAPEHAGFYMWCASEDVQTSGYWSFEPPTGGGNPSTRFIAFVPGTEPPKNYTEPEVQARVEAMARELCRIKGLDADGPHAIWSWPNAKDPDLLKQCREFIAMQLAYERTKG